MAIQFMQCLLTAVVPWAGRTAKSTFLASAACALVVGAPAAAQQAALPAPSRTPMTLDAASDPILSMGRAVGSADEFRRIVTGAVDHHPAHALAESQIAEGKANRSEAQAGLYPSADASLSSYQVISRDFNSFGLTNVVERTRPTAQTDGILSISQLAFDAGATSSRISAATARLRAAAASADDTSTRIALSTIGAWYDVYTNRLLVQLAEQFRVDQVQRRSDMLDRINQGVSAEADVARVDSALAGIDTRLAGYRRQLAGAEARYREMTGSPAPATVFRSPAIGTEPATVEEARAAAAETPAVKAVEEQARAARYEARASKRDAFPVVGASITAGRYGVFETDRDYDIRAQVTMRARLGGALPARINAAKARENGAEARALAGREEAGRDAAIAFGDLAALNQQLAAVEASYIASRQSRDTVAERFRVTRGALTDVLDVNDSYFAAASSYINTLADRDAAHYSLLAKTGRLLDAFGIQPAKEAYRIK